MLLQPITNPSKCARYIAILLSIWAFIYLFLPFNLRLDKTNPSHDDDDDEAHRDSSLSRHDICRPYGWKPYQPRQPSDPPRMIYDLVLVTTELDLLEVRLNTTWDAVDYYVLVESAKTFTGRNKPLLLQHALDSSSRFDAYKSKIIYHEVKYPQDFDPRPLTYTSRKASASASASGSGSGSVSSSPWEDFHLNAMFDQVFPSLAAESPTGNPSSHNSSSSSLTTPRRPQTNDILLLSLASEIPRPETLALLKDCIFPDRLTLSSKMHYYSFQFVRRPSWFSRTHEYGPGYVDQESKKVEWGHPQATVYKGVGGKTVRMGGRRGGLRYGFGSGSGSGRDVVPGDGKGGEDKKWWTTAEWMDKGNYYWLGLAKWLWDGRQQEQTLQNASWTCQFCFPTLSEFLLLENDNDGINHRRHRLGDNDELERDRVVRYVREGKDLWADIHEQQGGKKKWVFEDVVNNTDVPGFLLESPEGKEGGRLRFLMERGGRSGGFRDYDEASRVGVKDREEREETQEKVMGK